MDELADYQRELMPAAHDRLDEVMDEPSRWTAEVRITPVPAVEQKIYLQLACPLETGNRRTSPSVGRLARGYKPDDTSRLCKRAGFRAIPGYSAPRAAHRLVDHSHPIDLERK